MTDSIADDLRAIARIGAVPTILRTIRETTGLRFTFIARVLSDRWVACAIHDDIEFGLKVGGELDVKTTLCDRVRATLKPVIIDQASTDPTYQSHPTPKMYGFESYISVPIFRQNGEYFGTMCGLDPEPHSLKDGKTEATLKLFGELISLQLEADRRNEENEATLERELEASKLREEFIAVLGHDVRNPLSSIAMGVDLMMQGPREEKEQRILQRVRSSTRRIGALVDDLLDLARGRLGGGIGVQRKSVDNLPALLRHVVAEIQAAHPRRVIELEVGFDGPVNCDEKRIEQLLSNLLANAIEHGEAGSPVTVSMGGTARTFELEVVNSGRAISDDLKDRLFHPYARGAHNPSSGLGLGLYIVSEIAKSHDGKVEVESSEGHTAFTFTMPRG